MAVGARALARRPAKDPIPRASYGFGARTFRRLTADAGTIACGVAAAVGVFLCPLVVRKI